MGGCRQSSITVAADFPGKSACLNPWQGAATPAKGYLDTYVVSDPRGLPSQARIVMTASVLPQDAVSLDGSSMYYAARIIIDSAKTLDNPACGGCGPSACLVLNSIQVGRKPGAAGGDVLLQVPGAGAANWARWQTGTGADCGAVPVRSHTWGYIKSLYR